MLVQPGGGRLHVGGQFLHVGAGDGGVRHPPAGYADVQSLAGGGLVDVHGGPVPGAALRRMSRQCPSQLDGGRALSSMRRIEVVAVGQDTSTAVGGLDQGLWAGSAGWSSLVRVLQTPEELQIGKAGPEWAAARVLGVYGEILLALGGADRGRRVRVGRLRTTTVDMALRGRWLPPRERRLAKPALCWAVPPHQVGPPTSNRSKCSGQSSTTPRATTHLMVSWGHGSWPLHHNTSTT